MRRLQKLAYNHYFSRLKSYIISGRMLGRILVIKDSKIIAEIYAHRGQGQSTLARLVKADVNL